MADPIEVRVSYARSITAASKRIDVTSPDDVKAATRKGDKWKPEAWTYFDEVPEIKFAGRFVGNCLSRLRFFPAVVVNPDETPVAVQDAVGGDGGISSALAAACIDEMDRLNGADGQASLNREWGVNLTMTGDSYLVGEDDSDGEGWTVYSESAMTKVDGRLAIKETPTSKGRPLPDDALVIRIWRRHSRWPGISDSNMRSILAECEELLIYSRQFRAVGKSRNNAGLLLLPSELDVAPPPPTGDSPVVPQLTKLEADMIRSMITPISDDGSASAVVPHFLRGKAELLKFVRHIALDRKIDDSAIARVRFLIERLAHGIDVPVEVLTGVAEVNHWTAWQIEDTTYKAHIEPVAMIPGTGIARSLLRPALLERGFAVDEVRRIVVAVDPTDLVVRPNRAQDAKDAFKVGAISFEALVRYLGFSESDMPTIEERLLRYAFERGIGGQGLTREVMRLVGVEELLPEAEAVAEAEKAKQGELPAGDDAGADSDQPTPAVKTDEGQARRAIALARLAGMSTQLALTAAAGSAPIGERLAGIDQRLRDRLQIRASDALSNALRVAGQRLKARAQGDPEASSATAGVAPSDVAERLGEDTALAIADLDTLLAGSFDDLRTSFDSWVLQAQNETAAVIAALAVDEETADRAVATFTETQDDDRNDAWLLLLGSMRTLTRSRMFTPDGTPDDGEFDPTVSVPARDVRVAVARAGGSSSPTMAPTGQVGTITAEGATGGVATGPRTVRALTVVNQYLAAWEWRAGMPTVPFPPHHALDGVRFVSWTDERLSAAGSFTAYGHYFPGDHKGCQCDAVPVIVPEGDPSLPSDA